MDKKDLPAHSIIGRIVLGLVALWLVIYMIRAYVL